MCANHVCFQNINGHWSAIWKGVVVSPDFTRRLSNVLPAWENNGVLSVPPKTPAVTTQPRCWGPVPVSTAVLFKQSYNYVTTTQRFDCVRCDSDNTLNVWLSVKTLYPYYRLSIVNQWYTILVTPLPCCLLVYRLHEYPWRPKPQKQKGVSKTWSWNVKVLFFHCQLMPKLQQSSCSPSTHNTHHPSVYRG